MVIVSVNQRAQTHLNMNKYIRSEAPFRTDQSEWYCSAISTTLYYNYRHINNKNGFVCLNNPKSQLRRLSRFCSSIASLQCVTSSSTMDLENVTWSSSFCIFMWKVQLCGTIEVNSGLWCSSLRRYTTRNGEVKGQKDNMGVIVRRPTEIPIGSKTSSFARCHKQREKHEKIKKLYTFLPFYTEAMTV